MKNTLIPIFLLSLILLSGCYSSVIMQSPDKITSQYKGEVIPLNMNLYLSPELKSYVWVGRSLNFETKAYHFSVPLGGAIESASIKTFQGLFKHLRVVENIAISPGAGYVIVPSVNSYCFGVYDRVKTAGTLKSTISIKFKIFDDQKNTLWEEDVEGVGKKRMIKYFTRISEWNENLPLTTRLAVENAFKKISFRISKSKQIREYVLKNPQKRNSVAVQEKSNISRISRLYVNANPPDSRIRILNIKPKYKPGIQLKKGRYLLEVSKPGYKKQKKWITLEEGEDFQIEMALYKRDLAESSGEDLKTKVVATTKKEAKHTTKKYYKSAKDYSRQYWAVIIGISMYADTRIPSLRYATADANAFYAWLISPSGGKYAPNHIRLLLDKDATGKNIKNALFSWLRQAIKEDVVIIYFAGHGSPDSPDSPENLYLLPYDTQYDNITSTGFPMWDIETALKRFIRAKSVVIIADACHSGGIGQSFDIARRATRGLKINPINSRLEQLSKISGGIAVISASGDKQTSQEGEHWGGGHGVFTHYLLEGLKGKADYNQDRYISMGELIPYLSEQVRRATNNAQSPTIAGKFDPALKIGR